MSITLDKSDFPEGMASGGQQTLEVCTDSTEPTVPHSVLESISSITIPMEGVVEVYITVTGRGDCQWFYMGEYIDDPRVVDDSSFASGDIVLTISIDFPGMRVEMTTEVCVDSDWDRTLSGWERSDYSLERGRIDMQSIVCYCCSQQHTIWSGGAWDSTHMCQTSLACLEVFRQYRLPREMGEIIYRHAFPYMPIEGYRMVRRSLHSAATA